MEALIDHYNWTLQDVKNMTVRERRHWYGRLRAKKESISK
jgi:hypothetical protein